MIFDMLRWWYVSGWLLALQRIATRAKGVEQTFSLVILLQTLFSPWKRIITVSGKGMDAKMHATIDNIVSRAVGFFVRLFVIIAGLIVLLVAFVYSVVMVIVWPVLPVAFICGIVKAIIG